MLHFLLDAPVIRLPRFLHAVVAVPVREIGNDGYRLVGFLFALHPLGIHDNLTVENLLLDALVEVVLHRTDKHSLRQSGNLARRDKRVHLRVDGGGNILPIDGDIGQMAEGRNPDSRNRSTKRWFSGGEAVLSTT